MRIIDLFFPPMCPYCGKLTDRDGESCSKCAPLVREPIHTTVLKNGVLCASAFHYRGAYRQAVINYKYNGYGQYCRPFSLTCSRAAQEAFADIKYDLAAEVPLKTAYPGQRFAHMKRLARAAAKELDVPYAPLLYKTRAEEYQHFKTARERRAISRDLYRHNEKFDVAGKTIIVFDDIITTGSTMLCCTSALLAAGAKRVDGVTLMW